MFSPLSSLQPASLTSRSYTSIWLYNKTLQNTGFKFHKIQPKHSLDRKVSSDYFLCCSLSKKSNLRIYFKKYFTNSNQNLFSITKL